MLVYQIMVLYNFYESWRLHNLALNQTLGSHPNNHKLLRAKLEVETIYDYLLVHCYKYTRWHPDCGAGERSDN